MPQYDLIVPSGEAVLVDRATGVRLRLSAESGPLRLGSVTLDFAVEPKGLNASSGQPGEAAGRSNCPIIRADSQSGLRPDGIGSDACRV